MIPYSGVKYDSARAMLCRAMKHHARSIRLPSELAALIAPHEGTPVISEVVKRPPESPAEAYARA